MASSNAASPTTAKTGGRLGGKDLINIGIFTAIYFVVVFAVACLGFVPILMAAICGIIPLIAGIPYLLFLTRARKFGMITILGLLTGIIMFITGMGYFSIATGLICGVRRDVMAQFSFLMVLVPILGSSFLDLLSGEVANSSVGWLPLLLGFVSAFLSGLFACKVMIALVKKAKLGWFSLYCVIVAALVFIFM